LTDPDHASPPACPRESHLSAVGVSSDGHDAAVERAKRNLLTKLGNSIHIEAESFSRLVSVNGQQAAEYRDVQRVLEKVDFAHSDLIQIVGNTTRGAESYVVACLPRREAVARLEEDLGAAVTRFRVWDKTAWEAQSRQDRPTFVTAINHCSAAMATIAPTLVQIRALAGSPAEVERTLTKQWLALVEACTQARAQIRFVLNMDPDPSLRPVAGDVTELFRGALSPLGSEVRLGTTCSKADAATYLVRVHARAECGRGSLGTTCRPSFDVDGQECGSGRQVFRTGLDKIKVNGADPRGEEFAMRAMLRRLDVQAIRAELKVALKNDLPGEECR
jgi:hypothetical protein